MQSLRAALIPLLILFPLAAAAVPTLTITGGNTAFLEDSAAVAVDPALTLADPSAGNVIGARVSITSGFVPWEDVLAFTPQGGVTGSYSATTGILTLTGTASPATFQAVLRSVTYQNTQTNNPTPGTRQLTFSLSSSSLYFPANGHYYEFVASPSIHWTAALAAAAARNYYGLQGYLVTVTSAAENAFISSKLIGNGWMGASANGVFTVPRTWSWVSGPEAGTAFFTQTKMGTGNGGGVALGGAYTNWAVNEPNTYAGTEQYAHFYSTGTWNDYADNGTPVNGYVVEYGGMPGDPTPLLTGTKSVVVTACGTGCSVCSSGTVCTTCDNGLTLAAGSCSFPAPSLSITGGSTAFLEDSPAVPVDPGLTLVDPGAMGIVGARVSITTGFVPSEDVLAFTPQGGITGVFNPTTGILTLSGTANAATFQAVLRSVTYQNTQANNPTPGSRQISFSLSSSSLYFPTTGHYYEFVSSLNISWTAAQAAAAARSYYGLQGYLVTVTSGAENAFIASKLVGQGWMGAAASTFTVPRTWTWVTGPEAGTDFFTQTSMGSFNGGGVAIGANYINWATYEPNTNNGDEQYGHFYVDGTWNDYNNTGPVQGYVCEYGGMPGDPASALSGNKIVSVAACGPGCSACSDAYTCTTCDPGLTLSNGNCIGAVPTLSEWGMIIFMLVMAGTAFLQLRRARFQV
jgi:hypothetical protein